MAADSSESGNSPEFPYDTNLAPSSPILAHLSRATSPTPEEIVQAADIIGAAYREIEHTQDALNICRDLAMDVPNATTVLAEMIASRHEVLPKRWESDPEETRMVLSMVGYMEIGYLRAQQTAVRRGPAFPELSERVVEIEQLIEDLRR